ncbi:hypothetical protein [Cupriavidus numazuensis]|uniref:Uncharacterized protein n=1 Tax=Cupriavidus numazuensis TaxID=221992 RepID=A0ABM8TGC6_9BURK|nr:hypothetical protein [Cupriavidus numazuensis]CAG2144650.1 hypothetical protein LMG26411_02600 [Cupriavidus numazuensis]
MDILPFELVSVEEAKQVLDGDGTAPAQRDWTRLRGREPREAQGLTSDALRWLASLPAEARPMELCRRYPRIGNRLAALWGHCSVRTYLDDLVIDKRGGRQGFPHDVAVELWRLQEYLHGR